jgi:hypothetical protein
MNSVGIDLHRKRSHVALHRDPRPQARSGSEGKDARTVRRSAARRPREARPLRRARRAAVEVQIDADRAAPVPHPSGCDCFERSGTLHRQAARFSSEGKE